MRQSVSRIKNKQNIHYTGLNYSVELSDRTDASNTLIVCTKLVFNLSCGDATSRAVLHFYQTDDKILIQGSNPIQEVTAAVWLVESLIKPLQ